MELVCPSCASKHNTEDHPNAFEINCSCGYSLLVPDEEAMEESAAASESEVEEQFVNSAPLADVEDSEDFLSLDSVKDEGASARIEALPGSEEMTPPDMLPEGMVYDPFELPDIDGIESEEEAEVVDGAEVNELADVGHESEENIGDASLAGAVLSKNTIRAAEAQSPSPASVTPSKARILVERSHRASMGQFLGPDYFVELKDLERGAREEIVNRCQKILKNRPWLESELKRRSTNLEDLSELGKLPVVPEVLAVEIFLASFELGGSCVFKKSSSV